MEEEVKQMRYEIKELCKAVNRISQFAAVFSGKLSSHDEKLDAILNKMTSFSTEKISQKSNLSSASLNTSETHLRSQKTSSASTNEVTQQALESTTALKHQVSKSSFSDSLDKLCPDKAEKAHVSAAFLPYNMSTPSIPILNIEQPKTATGKQLIPCKSSPALTLNEYYKSGKVEFVYDEIDNNTRVADTKSKMHSSQSKKKQKEQKAHVSDVIDPCQTIGSNNEHGSNFQVRQTINPNSLNAKKLNQTNRNKRTDDRAALDSKHDKKRAVSTILSPSLKESAENSKRRLSFAGIVVQKPKHKEMAADEPTEKPKLKKENKNKKSAAKDSSDPSEQLDIPGGLQRIFDVQRQASTSSTASSRSEIDIAMGAESDSDAEDIEMKLTELPNPQFYHRLVSVKKSTYKHFYDLKEPIGGGRFGRVYRCVEKKTGLQLAAKCFLCKKPISKPLLKAKSLQRAQNLKTKRTQQEPVDKDDVLMEISIMNQIDHQNIVKLYDAYENDNTMTLIMEYLGGGELFERVIADQSQLTELDAVLFMKQIVTAIQYLHKNHILHLDLKPENILCLDRSTHHIKIIDFGLARKYLPRQKLFVQWGTPEFMAPEMFNYGAVSFPSDMWSIGIICYILLSGISPFLGDDDNETMENIVDCEWEFEEVPFQKVSHEAKDFVSRLLVEEKSGRMSAAQCLRHEWLSAPINSRKTLMNKNQLKNFMARMQWKASIAAVSAANWLKQKVSNVTDNVLSRDTAV